MRGGGMKILVACEESQAVTIEMRKLGHEAFSCDLQGCSGGHPEWHILGDALELISAQCKSFTTMDGITHTHTHKVGHANRSPALHIPVKCGCRQTVQKN
jgi:hypothetical protein